MHTKRIYEKRSRRPRCYSGVPYCAMRVYIIERFYKIPKYYYSTLPKAQKMNDILLSRWRKKTAFGEHRKMDSTEECPRSRALFKTYLYNNDVTKDISPKGSNGRAYYGFLPIKIRPCDWMASVSGKK